MYEDINNSKASGKAGHAPQALEAQLPCEEPSPLQPGADVLPAQGLGLGDHLLHGHGPPTQRRRKLSRDRVAHVGEPAIAPCCLGEVQGGDLVVVGRDRGCGGEAHLPRSRREAREA